MSEAEKDQVLEVVCPNCAGSNSPGAHFCKHCVTPLSTFAATDPMGSIYARMDTLGKASRGSPKPIVVVGMWLLLGPTLCVFVGLTCAAVKGIFASYPKWGDIWWCVAGVIFGAGFGAIPAILLWRTTANYFRMRGVKEEEEEEKEGEEKEWEADQDEEEESDKSS